jgi:hypothetical protein
MTIEEAKKKREILEDKIYKLIVDFNEETGLFITNIDLSIVDTNYISGKDCILRQRYSRKPFVRVYSI